MSVGTSEGNYYLGGVSVTVWTGLIWLEMGPVAGSYEEHNESAGSTNGRECVDKLNNC
jgi:hypothetical protein